MCWMAIASGEENCRCCDGYSTCPQSTIWEDEPEEEWPEPRCWSRDECDDPEWANY